MSKQESVSSAQMSMLFLSFMTGSSIVIVPAPLINAAGNGAWLSLLLAWLIGFLLLGCVLYLYRKYPGMSFIQYSRHTLGGWLTAIILLPYVCVMFWHVAGIVSEISVFFKSTMLRETPSYAINALFFIAIALTVRNGIEVIARMAVILSTLMFGFIILILGLVAPMYHPEYLEPIMPQGIGPILHGAYIAYGFPYSELVVFAMLLPFVRKEEGGKVGKHLFFALILNGFTLLASIVSSMMVLGPLAGDLKFSLYQLSRLIFVREIIERIESVIGFSLTVGFYIKSAIMLYILMKVLSQLLHLKDDRFLVYPVAMICMLLSLTTYRDETSLGEQVNIIWPLLDNTAYIAPMLLIAVVSLIRRRMPA
ncbi:endospore germination permease [Paenibacillus sp. GYB004]|uniref:GerAB/ArcD/ProY family transporter n=1 Tax=Paenibacillus sp. GYB004 TaxID=2994393 RepID=UPI002F96A90D